MFSVRMDFFYRNDGKTKRKIIETFQKGPRGAIDYCEERYLSNVRCGSVCDG